MIQGTWEVVLLAPRLVWSMVAWLGCSGDTSGLSWSSDPLSCRWLRWQVWPLQVEASTIGNNPSYAPTRWQGTLFVFATSAFQGLVNTFLAAQLPRIQKLSVLLQSHLKIETDFENRMIVPHAMGWIAVVVVLWVLAPHASPKDMFTNFSSNGG